MLGLVIIGSIVGIGLILWVFSRLAWGGGMQTASYDLLRPQVRAADGTRGAGLPQADIESIELRCTTCAFVKKMPEIARVPAYLSNTAIQLGDQAEIKAPCPECGERLKSWLRRDIVHHGPAGEVRFATLRRGTSQMFVFDGVTYPSLGAVPSPTRAIIAAATNSTEEV
jgi:hypothetical protein